MTRTSGNSPSDPTASGSSEVTMGMERTASHDRLDRLRTLTEVSRALTYTSATQDVLRLTVERAAELMGGDKALIMLTDAAGLLTVRAAHGVDAERIGTLHEPLNETLVRRLQDLLGYPLEECFLSVPLVAQGQVTGLLAVVRPVGAPQTDDDEWLLSALADQAAVALENARLTEAVQLGQADRERIVDMQGRTQATLGHELRSPLSAILAYSALLLDEEFGSLRDRQRESVARIQMSGQHLLAIIENVLDVARINAGVLHLSPSVICVESVLAEAVQMVQPRATEKHQDLRVGPAGDVMVQADANRLRQALVNLIGNAIKYSPQGGAVEVVASAREMEGRPFVALAIADNGPGIPADLLDAIFEPYDRGAAASHEPGLGLGLFIARELVRQMGGDIRVRSEPGAGSTFTALLPRVAPPLPGAAPPAGAVP
jgi:phosphoserine phosphatase RsbU/P